MERAQRRHEFDRPARGVGKMCRALREKDPVLSFSTFGEAGNHRLGAGKLSLWRKRRRRDQQASIRSLLHKTLFIETRRHDRTENCPHDVVWEGKMSICFGASLFMSR